LRLIINTFLIIIIVLSLSIIPINYHVFEFELPDFHKDKVVEENIKNENEVNYLEIKNNEDQSLLNNQTFKITINTTNKEEISDIINSFTVEISNATNLVKTISLKDISNTFEENVVDINNFLSDYSNQDIYVYNYTFNLNNLDLTSNHYIVNVKSTDKRIKDVFTYEFNHFNNNKYIGSSNKPIENKLYTKLYYSDENFMRLVPVNKMIDTTDRFIRATMNELLIPPNEKYGLSTTINAPRIKNIAISRGTANLDFNSSEITNFNNGSTSAYFAINSIVNTISKFSVVDQVKFFVDGNNSSDYFHGTDLSEPFIVKNSAKAYVGLETSKKTMMLYPIEITETNLNNKILSIVSILKTLNFDNESKTSLIPTLPINVKLLNYRFDDKNIELDFSKEFLSAYNGNKEYNSIMYESLLYSFTSIEGINSVSIIIEGEKIDLFNGIDISTPQKPNMFINTLN